MPQGTHPIPARTTSAYEGPLTIVPVAFLEEFHALPPLTPSPLTPCLSPGHRPLKAEFAGSSPLRSTNVYGRQNHLRDVARQPVKAHRASHSCIVTAGATKRTSREPSLTPDQIATENLMPVGGRVGSIHNC